MSKALAFPVHHQKHTSYVSTGLEGIWKLCANLEPDSLTNLQMWQEASGERDFIYESHVCVVICCKNGGAHYINFAEMSYAWPWVTYVLSSNTLYIYLYICILLCPVKYIFSKIRIFYLWERPQGGITTRIHIWRPHRHKPIHYIVVVSIFSTKNEGK